MLVTDSIAGAIGVEIDCVKVFDKGWPFLERLVQSCTDLGFLAAGTRVPELRCLPVEQVSTP